jgi:hypothetical protein
MYQFQGYVQEAGKKYNGGIKIIKSLADFSVHWKPKNFGSFLFCYRLLQMFFCNHKIIIFRNSDGFLNSGTTV